MPLPVEILTLVFTYLPQRDLDTVQLVCKSWKEIANDKVWKDQFNYQFGTNKISPVSSYFTQWRRELIVRNDILHRWKKCSKDTDITLNSNLIDNTQIFCSFGSDVARATCFNSHKGAGTIIELDRGKIQRKIYASRYSRETLPVAAMDGSRFGMAYGFLDGGVTTVAFARDGTVATEYTDLPYKHEAAVSAVWIAKTRKFSKPTNRSIGIATGSIEGTVTLYNSRGHESFHPERSPALLLEGSMCGSYAADDGDIVVVYYANGRVYRFSCTEESIDMKLLASIPHNAEHFGSISQLYLCNNYAVLQGASNVFLVDLVSGELTEMQIPDGADMTAFSIDKSRIPGTKYIAAGLSTNEICVWAIPPLDSADTASGEAPRIELVQRKAASPGPEDASNPATSKSESADREYIPNGTVPNRSDAAQVAGRHVDTQPFWTIQNPIGYEHRLAQSEKPQITQVALNSAVLLVAGYNGLVMAVDLLSARPLKRVSSRISKNVLDLTRYSRDGFVPVTHLIIDPDPLRLRCLISVRPAVQYFDLGTIGLAKDRRANRKRSSKPKHRGAGASSLTTRHDLEEAIELHDDFSLMDEEREQANASLMETFGVEGMEQEEQMQYAMMLSQNAEDEIVDDDLLLALRLSENQQREEHSAVQPDADPIDEEESLRRAIELSLQTI